ncbi:MAG TPA: LptE family protein [Humisphaera sp.]
MTPSSSSSDRAARTARGHGPRRQGVRLAARGLTVLSALLAALAALAAGGCGYQMSGSAANAPAGYGWTSLYRTDVKTVAVPIFTNRTFYRNVEFDLTKAVANQLEAKSPYKIAPRERADTVLEGEIVKVRERTVSNSPNNALPQEQLYIVRVNFIWKDLRTGKILVERKDFEQAASFYPNLGEGQFVGNQDSTERLALAIVQELQAAW